MMGCCPSVTQLPKVTQLIKGQSGFDTGGHIPVLLLPLITVQYYPSHLSCTKGLQLLGCFDCSTLVKGRDPFSAIKT